MVTATAVGQLSGECTLWRDALRTFRNSFIHFQSQLTQISSRQMQHDIMLEVEHLHNQFHIQLINIHDLKQSIKKHMGKISFERSSRGRVTDDTLARHDLLQDEYKRLDATLHMISREFDRFVKRVGR